MAIKEHVKQSEFRTSAEAAFVGLLVAAGHAMQRLDEACGEHGITHVQYNVLRILRGAHPDGHPRFEIADRLMTRAPDVTRMLDRLERQGLIERGWAKNNRRLSIARITKKGLDLLRAVDPKVQQIHSATLGRLSDQQLKQLSRALDTMVP
jgi:DNA-binding MarR family transcriptional regulator